MKIINQFFRTFVIMFTSLLLLSTVILAEGEYEPVKVQRLYNKVSGAHLLSADPNEVSALTQGDWINEGVCFYSPSVATEVEVKRFYNPVNGNALYTKDQNEWKQLQEWRWQDEGLAFYGAVNQLSYPIHRLFNPKSEIEPYLFTSDSNEYNVLPTLDPNDSWRQEGIGWYAESVKNVAMYKYEDQKLDLPSIDNSRQLSGYVMTDGRKVKNNILLRSGALDSLSERDKQLLENLYHLKEIVDFRSDQPQETGGHPDIVPDGAINHTLPAFDTYLYDEDTLRELSEVLNKPDGVSSIDVSLVLAKHNGMKQLYNKILKSNAAKNAYREMFNILLDNAKREEPGAVLWHCTQGKDRAGIASALILTALGADDATIRRDYSLTTNFYLDEIRQMEQLANSRNLDENQTRELLGLIGVAYPGNLQLAIDSVGSFREYIIKDLGFTEMT